MKTKLLSWLLCFALTAPIINYDASNETKENAKQFNLTYRYVNGYYRSDGIYVHGYWRDNSNDGYEYNNVDYLRKNGMWWDDDYYYGDE